MQRLEKLKNYANFSLNDSRFEIIRKPTFNLKKQLVNRSKKITSTPLQKTQGDLSKCCYSRASEGYAPVRKTHDLLPKTILSIRQNISPSF